VLSVNKCSKSLAPVSDRKTEKTQDMEVVGESKPVVFGKTRVIAKEPVSPVVSFHGACTIMEHQHD